MPAQTKSEPVSTEGTFEYIEAKIRHDAEGTLFGGDFEWLCQWFLENAPRYRGQFDKVWLWKDWPERWGGRCGNRPRCAHAVGGIVGHSGQGFWFPPNDPEIRDRFVSV